MLTCLAKILLGWKELRTSQGYSYQISRTGKRRVVPVADYGRRGQVDEIWLLTGTWGDEAMTTRFRNYTLPLLYRRKSA
jgi:hypothetical protein